MRQARSNNSLITGFPSRIQYSNLYTATTSTTTTTTTTTRVRILGQGYTILVSEGFTQTLQTRALTAPQGKSRASHLNSLIFGIQCDV